MAPEHEARPRAAVYDHESDEPRRRRRPAADWGVGEDIFDRMPSRRFKRGERRAEHQEIVIRRADAEGQLAVAQYEADVYDEPARRADEGWDETPRRRTENQAPRRVVAAWDDEAPRRTVEVWSDDTPADGGGSRRPVESWLDDEDRPLVRGESRTIVLSRDPEPEYFDD